MNPIAMYFVALGLFVLGFLFMRNTSPYSRAVGAKYKRKKRRKLIGELVLIMGALVLVMAIIAQFFSDGL